MLVPLNKLLINTEIEIEDGIPIPEDRLYKYPFQTIEVGQSFWAEKTSRQFSSYAAYWGKKLDRKFKCNGAVKGGKHGCRVWRIK